MALFAFKDELETSFVLSEVLEKKEKGFYKFSEEGEPSGIYVYDGQEMRIEDLEFLEGYSNYRNNTLVSTNQLAKMLFHRDIVKVKDVIKPLNDKEITEIAKKLVNHQIHEYGGIDQESYVFFHNLAKTEIIDILTAETEEEALNIILNSIVFNESEKKAAKVVYESKDKYFSSFLSSAVVEEALNQGAKAFEPVKIRDGIFEKRYVLHPAAINQYFDIKIRELAQLEKQIIEDPENVPGKVVFAAEALAKEIIESAEKIDPDGIVFNRKKNRNIKFLISQGIIKEVLGADRLEHIRLDLKEMEAKGWDTYRFLGYLKAFIDYINMNILTYNMVKKNLDPVVLRLIKNRIKKVKTAIEKGKVTKETLKKKYGYKDMTINTIKYFKE